MFGRIKKHAEVWHLRFADRQHQRSFTTRYNGGASGYIAERMSADCVDDCTFDMVRGFGGLHVMGSAFRKMSISTKRD
ncbi:hypothetical protein DV714_14255 [Parageobacillus thermoglucosidasius]|nr:hypothetical protein DV714_14255 [Parageobacillus thermoglucosidasius]